MNEEQTPSGKSPEPDLNPVHSHVDTVQEPTSTGLKIMIVLFVVLAGIAAGYGWLQHDAAQQLAAQRSDLSASLAQAKGQEDALAAKVNAMSAAQAQEEAARAQSETVKNEQFPPRASGTPRHTTHHAVANRKPADDPRWKQIQGELGDQQKELTESQNKIAETQANLDQAKTDLQGNLDSARTELGGDIARSHDELVALEKKGERNYYEFSFEKSKTYHHTGPISIALRKADNRHGYCDLEMMVDDKEISRKHVNLYESLSLHPEGFPVALEVVINHIDKDSVQGYVSEPKYRSTERAAVSVPVTPAAASANPPAISAPDPDVKLEHRDDAH